MNRSKPSATSQRVTTMASIAFLFAGAFLLFFPENTRAQYERLERNPIRAAEWDIRDNINFRVLVTRQEVEVTATPVRGGKATTIYRYPREKGIPVDVRIVGDEVLMVTRPPVVSGTLMQSGQVGGGLFGDGTSILRRSYGDILLQFDLNEYLAPPNAKISPPSQEGNLLPTNNPGEDLRRERPLNLVKNQPSPTLHRISLKNGTTQTVKLDTQGYLLDNLARCITTTGLYWVRPHSTYVLDVSSMNGPHTEGYARDTLMVSPLDGGPARPVKENIYFSMLLPLGEGCCGRLPAVYPAIKSTLFIFEGNKIQEIPNYEGHEAPVLFQGRYYWVENRKPTMEEPQAYSRLLSCPPNGKDRQIHTRVDSTEEKPRHFLTLFEHQGQLYTLLVHRIYNRGVANGSLRSSSDFRNDPALIRITPNAPEPLGNPLRLPETAGYTRIHAHAGYLYFYLAERRRSPMDVFFEQVYENMTVTICRTLLPLQEKP